jgi:hypothetical protein
LFELAHRKATGKIQAEAQQESAEIYAEFSKIAQTNSGAWFFGESPKTADEIKTVSKDNRMICYPCELWPFDRFEAFLSTPHGLDPLLMNAIMQNNQSFGIIMMSTEEAAKLGIPESRWIYVKGGAGGADSKDVMQRACYHRSFAMEQSFEQAVAVSGLKRGLAEIDLIDLYSVGFWNLFREGASDRRSSFNSASLL